MAELTVVMAVHNGERYLGAALESIATQSIRDFDVLVVDDGSTDGSALILEGYSRGSARLTVIHQKNAGMVAALNRACGLVRSPYIARLDADDISMHDRLERQLHFVERHPDVALVGGGAEVIDESGDLVSRVDVPTSHEEITAVLHERNVFVHSAVVIRRDAWLAVGGYRRAFSNAAEDYDLWLRIAERYRVANLADVLVRYRLHRGQTTTRKLEAQALAVMGARLSARLRRAGREDPFGAMESVSREALLGLGVAIPDIEDEVARAAANWAKVMGRAGYHDTAMNLARQAWRGGRSRALTRDEVGGLYFAAARASLARGRLAHGLVTAVRALRWQPALLGRMLREGLRRLTRSGPRG